jgi:hypothetical protein
MEFVYELLYRPGIPLQIMGLLVGLWLVGTHGYALLRPDQTADFLKKFPRNEKIGIILNVIGFVWTYIVWTKMDLGEFSRAERLGQVALIAGCYGMITYVKEFIAVRSLGFLLILATAPILISAFLKEPTTRLLLVAFAYAASLVGMFWVGMPYLLRDWIDWVLADRERLRYGAIGGISYGALILLCAVCFWG